MLHTQMDIGCCVIAFPYKYISVVEECIQSKIMSVEVGAVTDITHLGRNKRHYLYLSGVWCYTEQILCKYSVLFMVYCFAKCQSVEKKACAQQSTDSFSPVFMMFLLTWKLELDLSTTEMTSMDNLLKCKFFGGDLFCILFWNSIIHWEQHFLEYLISIAVLVLF